MCVCVRERERERESMRMDCAASEQEEADAIENSAAGRARPGAGWIEEEHAGPPPPPPLRSTAPGQAIPIRVKVHERNTTHRARGRS